MLHQTGSLAREPAHSGDDALQRGVGILPERDDGRGPARGIHTVAVLRGQLGAQHHRAHQAGRLRGVAHEIGSERRQCAQRDVQSLHGGIDAWSAEVDPSVPRYI